MAVQGASGGSSKSTTPRATVEYAPPLPSQVLNMYVSMADVKLRPDFPQNTCTVTAVSPRCDPVSSLMLAISCDKHIPLLKWTRRRFGSVDLWEAQLFQPSECASVCARVSPPPPTISCECSQVAVHFLLLHKAYTGAQHTLSSTSASDDALQAVVEQLKGGVLPYRIKMPTLSATSDDHVVIACPVNRTPQEPSTLTATRSCAPSKHARRAQRTITPSPCRAPHPCLQP